jgi:thioredoxin reductase (NADPH)
MTTTEVDNWPADVMGVQGPELMQRFQEHAERFKTEIVFDHINQVDFSQRPFRLQGDSASYTCDTLVVSTGASAKYLGLPSEQAFMGRGVSGCATCDGFFFRQKTIAVVGGGDSALEEATFLTKFADKVYLVHRKDTLRASKAMQERAFSDPKIEILWNKEVAHIYGEQLVSGIGLVDTVTGAETTLDVAGLFIAIGADPRTHLVHGQLDLTEHGTIAVDGRSSRTNLPGVFAAGDVIDPTYRQAVTAAGSGTVAALDTEHYLAALPKDLLARASAPAVASV